MGIQGCYEYVTGQILFQVNFDLLTIFFVTSNLKLKQFT